jgi:heterodisulfide reductase subunit B
MGRIVTPTYRVEYRTNLLAMKKFVADKIGTDGRPCFTQVWRGPSTEKNLENWRKEINKSFQKDGSNYHLTLAMDAVDHVYYACIVHQKTGKVMATVTAPAFEVV